MNIREKRDRAKTTLFALSDEKNRMVCIISRRCIYG
jgi:hypothetical protein